jgi:type IV secretory pathway VirB10-like protein
MKRKIEGLLDLFALRRAPPRRQEARPADPPPPVLPPRPPLAKRLNRNALTVAAVLMGMTVLTSIVVLNTGHPVGASAAPVESVTPAAPPPTPTFLDRPVPGAPETLAPGVTARPEEPAIPQDAYPLVPPKGPTRSQAAERSRERAYREALTQSPVVSSVEASPVPGSVGNPPAPTATPVQTDTDAEDRFLAASDSVMQNAMRAATGGSSDVPSGADLSNARRAFLREAGDSGAQSVIARLEPSGSPYTIREGTVIPGVLLTAIASDLPGECLGQVSRDVYDSRTQSMLLIPKGSKLLCRYDDQVAVGQGRLLVAWTRLIFPDGRSMTLPGLPLKDPQGQTGAVGSVDTHMGQAFGRALLLSAISAGAQLSQPRQGSILATPSTGQIAAGAAGQELSNVALDLLRRGMDQPPTITIPQGAPFNVFLNGDLVFNGPYAPAP